MTPPGSRRLATIASTRVRAVWSLLFAAVWVGSAPLVEADGTPACTEATELVAHGDTLVSTTPCDAECRRQRRYFYGQAAAICPTNAAAPAGLADVHLSAGEFAAAGDAYRRALALDPDFAPALLSMGNLALREGRYADAIHYYDRITPRDAMVVCALDVAGRLAAHEVLDAPLLTGCIARPATVTRGAQTTTAPRMRLPFSVRFAEGSAALDDHATAQLDQVAAALKTKALSTAAFVIEGHSDAGESPPDDVRLSTQRAEGVRTYLIKRHRIDPSRLAVRAFGSSRPMTDGTSATAKVANRRSEFVQVTDAGERDRPHLTAEILVEDPNERRLKPLGPRGAVPSGAHYALRISSPENVHVYAVQEDSAAQVTCLFPNPSFTSDGNPIRAGIDYTLPKDKLFRLDDVVGRERIYVVATRRPAQDLEYLLKHPERRKQQLIVQVRTRGVAPELIEDTRSTPLERALAKDDDAVLKVIAFDHVQGAPGASTARSGDSPAP